MSVLIRCNAGVTVGFGHLVRCRVLADALLKRGEETVFIGPPESLKQAGDEKLFSQWIERPEWQGVQSEAKFHIELAKRAQAKHIILDDYRSDYAHQLLLREAGLRCLQQYDASTPQRFAAQLVINSSPAESRSDYEEVLYSPDIQMLHGPKYAILRPEFLTMQKHPASDKKRVLITFGGGDDRGAIVHVLNELREGLLSNVELVIVSGAHNPRNDEITQTAKNMPTQLYINPPNMAELIAGCDIAISGGGTTTFEAAYFGLPMILMPIATNQYEQSGGWEKLGAAIDLGAFPAIQSGEVRRALQRLLEDEKRFCAMSEAGLSNMDGQGTQRIIDMLLSQESKG